MSSHISAVLLMAACVVYPVIGVARDFVPDKQGAEILRVIIADDAHSGILENGNSGFNYTSWIGPYIKTTTAEMEADYLRARATADQKYSIGLTVFSGFLSIVKRDADGRPYLVMQSREAFREIQARMEDNASTIDTLRSGSEIELVCKELAFGALAPVFHHCLLKDTFAKAEGVKAADAAVEWLQDGKVPAFLSTPEDRLKAFAIYYAGSKIKDVRPCLSARVKLDACEAQLKSVDLDTPEFRSAAQASATAFGPIGP